MPIVLSLQFRGEMLKMEVRPLVPKKPLVSFWIPLTKGERKTRLRQATCHRHSVHIHGSNSKSSSVSRLTAPTNQLQLFLVDRSAVTETAARAVRVQADNTVMAGRYGYSRPGVYKDSTCPPPTLSHLLLDPLPLGHGGGGGVL